MDVNDIVTIPKIIENTERLACEIERLRETVKDDIECRAAANRLLKDLRWFLEDLDKSDGQLDVLLCEYDRKRKDYYRLRRVFESPVSETSRVGCSYLSDGSNSKLPVTSPNQSPNQFKIPNKSQEHVCDDGNPMNDDQVTSLRTTDCLCSQVNCAYKVVATDIAQNDAKAKVQRKKCGLYRCPGRLDVTKDNPSREFTERSMNSVCDGKEKDNGKSKNDWMSEVRKFCCFCLPIQCLAFLSVKYLRSDRTT